MIPEFPQFKSLELADKEDVEKFTHKFPPYSDFNFVSMWSWDIKGEMRISQLHGNLVVRFTDYLTSEPFYSFLGNNKVNETAETLLALSKKERLKQVLKLVPEEVANDLVVSDFVVTFDENSFDYIYLVPHLSDMNNWAQHSSGKNIRSYKKSCPSYIVKHQFIRETRKDEYVEMFKIWAKNKEIEDYSKLKEYKALERIFEIKEDSVRVVSVYVDNILKGFTMYEMLSSDYAISHFAKADNKHHCAMGDILNWEEAKILNTLKVKHFNWEQDLGIPGLRQSKEKYKPSFFLKKFHITKN